MIRIITTILIILTTNASYELLILLTNVIESIKWIESKQLAGFIFACYFLLASRLPSLAGFAVQSLLAVSPCQLASMEEGRSWKYHCPWHRLRTLSKIWVEKAEGTTDASWHHFHVVHIASCTSPNTCPVRQHTPSACLTAWVIVRPGQRALLISSAFRAKYSS